MLNLSLRSWRPLLVLFVLVGLSAPAAEIAAVSPLAAPAAGTLYLSDGSFVSGGFADSRDPGVLRWEAALFARPLDFFIKGIDAITFPAPDKLPRSTGEYCFELSGGGVLFGSLVALDDVEAVLDVASAGRLHVRRDALREFFRWKDGAGLVYQGPNGLGEWTVSPTRDAWKHERGQLSTDAPRSFIQGNFALPARAVVEFEISWIDKPDFVLALGMGRDDASLSQAFHVESWLTDVVILRETAREAEIASLEKLTADVHRAHFLIYVDQEQGRCLAYSPNGKLLADFRIMEKNQAPLSGLRLINRKGTLRLERLRVSHWSGAPPRTDVALDKPRIHLADGTIQYGELASYDAAKKTFTVRASAGAGRPTDQIESVFLGPKLESAAQPLCVAYQDATRLNGRLLKVEHKRLWLECPGIREPLSLPLDGLRSLVFNGSAPGPLETPDGVRIGILEADGVRLPGFLVDGGRQKDSSAIVWNPRGSGTASPLWADADGKIVYREPSAPVRHIQPRSQPMRRRVIVQGIGANGVGIRRIIENPLESVQQEPPHDLTRKALYLMTGDAIPCEVTRIDETGLTFKSPVSASTFVPHEKIKAVELTLDGRGPVVLTRTKRERLLTLPRMQKGNPPTHLIRSRDGDYLRGRIVEMDDKRLVVEVRMQRQEIPRERISRIIWLHPDEPAEAGHPAKPASPAPANQVQAQLEDGNRLTFSPEKVKDSVLSGSSDAIGLCRVGVEKIDQLLFGTAIKEAATRAAYQQWKLQYAQEPKYLQEENGNAAGAAGTESMLVGKAAPDFELEMMGGDRFRLSEHKGKIVVLDFWATWCSHCLQSMPELVRMHDSSGPDVEVIAVNLEETPEAISTMLDRHKWKIPVALDREGAVATKYGVTAIPQTVVIGREGTVVRHFIGGGSNVTKNLAESVKGLLPAAVPAAPKTSSKNR